MRCRPVVAVAAALLAAACSAPASGPAPSHSAGPSPAPGSSVTSVTSDAGAGRPFDVAEVARLDAPWAMTTLPGGRALVTEKAGTLRLVDLGSGRTAEVAGAPAVDDAGQGGLGDIVLAPTFASDSGVYLSWAQQADGVSRAVVGRARLRLDGSPRLEGLTPIWHQDPSTGSGHYSHRLAVSPDGRHLFVSSGERQKMEPAQDLSTNLGKILRLDVDGRPALGNPFADRGGVAAQVWSLGHRNVLGLAFDDGGRLWAAEMGPQGGDEIDLVERGANYGWPRASNGSHYDGRDIPGHSPGDGFAAPKVWWNPSISPAGLMIYRGARFPQWKGDAFVGALSGEALVRIDLDGASAREGDRWPMGTRIREVEQGPDGAIYLLEDGGGSPGGRLLRLTPPR